MTPIAADYPFLDILWTMIIFFVWVCWIWALILILSDVFGRHDLSGWSKAAWTLFVIILPFLGVLIYLCVHGGDMGERRMKQAEAAAASAGYSRTGDPAEQIEQAKRLLDSGAIDQREFDQLKAKALA